MPYTVTDLITRAYYLSGIVNRDLETVSSPQARLGLDCLNDVLGDKRVEKSMVPYFKPYDFVAVIGQQRYFVPHLIEATSITFFLQSVRYAMYPVNRDAWFGAPRAENIQSLPFNYHVEREFNEDPLIGPIGPGASIYFYFVPQETYPMQAWGKFDMSLVVQNQDLELTLDRFYINYLRYKLCERLCDEYDYDVPDRVEAQIEDYEDLISKQSAILDMTVQKISTLNDKCMGLNYAQANLGKGFDVP